MGLRGRVSTRVSCRVLLLAGIRRRSPSRLLVPSPMSTCRLPSALLRPNAPPSRSARQIDGLSSEIKSLITKYNSAQNTIAEQQRLLEELQVGAPLLTRNVLQQLYAPVRVLALTRNTILLEWNRRADSSVVGGRQPSRRRISRWQPYRYQ